jgi:hypothetical protein
MTVLFEDRIRLTDSQNDPAFWRNRPRDPKLQVALRQLDREQRQMLRDALGADPDESARTSLYQHKNLGFLPEEKATDVRRVLRDYDEKRADLYAAAYTQSTDVEKMRAIEKEQQDALAAVLTPTELREYDLRFSRTATTLREDLSAFSPTEQEFQTMDTPRPWVSLRFFVLFDLVGAFIIGSGT